MPMRSAFVLPHRCALAAIAGRESHSGAAASVSGIHGHCPLFTHPAAGLAFNVGEATDVARVPAGGAAVTVAPIFIAVGSTDIVGTTGET
jgi:hypothetical protein